MNKLTKIKTVTFSNGYKVDLPYEVTVDLNSNKDQVIFEILIKQIIKLKEELNGKPKTKHRR